VETENFEVWVNTPMHAKATVIDGQTTIFNASPLLQEYYDDTNHHLRNQKRGKMSWKPFNWFPTKNAIRVPIHDVNVKIEGAASVDVETTFKLLWEHEGQEFTDSAQSTNIGNEHVQIVRTLPGNTFNNMYYGETGILQAYQRAFENAQSLIYIENQYLTNKRIAQSLFSALKRNATLELIVLMNNAVDIPGYFASQNKLVGDFIKNARSEGFGNRIGFFTRWTYEQDGQTFAVVRNYVHAKVGIVDDVWATIGSANLDGTSLDLSEHLLWISRDDQYEERAVEMNAVFINGIEGFNHSTVPLNLRNSLFTEHLGMTLNQSPAGGWLQQWKNKANETLQNIKTRNPGSPRILEWNNMEDPVEYLKKAGVTSTELKQIHVYKEVPSFDFSKKEWV
jgi:phosphatidylserine/phosphatidylglycerophosphate/cardiolipin synthase-like enzyme